VSARRSHIQNAVERSATFAILATGMSLSYSSAKRYLTIASISGASAYRKLASSLYSRKHTQNCSTANQKCWSALIMEARLSRPPMKKLINSSTGTIVNSVENTKKQRRAAY
jgi:hypothetical protein